MYAAFGIVAGILQLVASAPYVRDILRGSTRPQRATWTIWTTLSFVVLASQWASGATWSLALVIGQTAACAVIFVLAMGRGVGGVSRVELVLLGIAAIGIAGWQIADDPIIATCSVVVADLIGMALMLPKTYRSPGSETASTFAIGGVSTLFALAAIETLTPALALYPAYILVADVILVTLIVLRRRALAVARSLSVLPQSGGSGVPSASSWWRSDSTAAWSKRKYERGGRMPQRFEPRGSSRHSRAAVREVEHLHVAIELHEQVLLGDPHIPAEVLPERVAHRAPAEPAAVLAEMIERHPQRAPIDQVEREMMEMRGRLADQRHHVMVGVDVQPHALCAEVVGHPHPEHITIEIAHRLELTREHIDMPSLRARKPGKCRRRLPRRRDTGRAA